MIIVLERAKSSILPNGNFREFFLWQGNFAFSKREFPENLQKIQTENFARLLTLQDTKPKNEIWSKGGGLGHVT